MKGKATNQGGMDSGPAQAQPPPPRRILLVEDEPDIRDSMKDLLEASLPGVHVTTAESAAEGLRLLPDLAPHLVVSDYRMPGEDGLHFLAAARRQAPHTPRVLMTAYPDLTVALRGINEAHVHTFLAKPLDVTSTLQRIADILEKIDAQQDEARKLARALRKVER